MNLDDKQILEILFKENFITEDLYKQAKTQEGDSGSLDFLFDQGVVNKDLVGQAVAENLGVSYADLNSIAPNREQLDLLKSEQAIKWRAIVFKSTEKELIIATDVPTAKGLKIAMQSALKNQEKTIIFAYSLTGDVDAALRYYRKALSDQLKEIVLAGGRAPEVVNTILENAINMRSSDIHMEPQEGRVVLRFRVDGIMQIVGEVEYGMYEMVLNRIKVLSKLRTDKHQNSQDGSIRYRTEEHSVDLRVSIVPIFDGEKVVMRLLTQYSKDFSLGSLGISTANQELIQKLANKPFGMIIVCGPTGSGKTTTLYGVLKQLNKPEVNIATIEDPVEYKIGGVNHIQVNREADLTFARGLRSIVRQDPDIILVGEIRDVETAEISVNAALTGHLLLSTFHANDAATSIPRLLDMNIEPFLLSSTLEAVISQRLVRTICEACKFSYTVSKSELDEVSPMLVKLIPGSTYRFYKGKKCSSCSFSGFKGRTAIFEIIQTSPEIQEAIMKEPTSQNIWSIARRQGSASMFEDGLGKALRGITSLDELLRVVEPPKQLKGVVVKPIRVEAPKLEEKVVLEANNQARVKKKKSVKLKAK